MLMVAIVIAVAMKIVGVLLIASLLVIPPATARFHTTSPEQMAISASILGMLSICLGLTFSYYSNAPTGPAIVLSTAMLFIVSFIFRRKS